MFRWVDHTAELELELEAPTERGLFEEALAALPHLVKAVTHHRLELGRSDGVWRARAVLDV